MTKTIGALLVLFLACSACSHDEYIPRNGDIIFQTSRSSQSKAIQLATHSKWSHVGIVFIQDGKPYVLEAIQPVVSTPLQKWVARGENHHFVAKRLRNSEQILSSNAISKMRKIGKKFVGRNYDPYFGWSDDRIYCSELIWKIYDRGAGIKLSALSRMGEFDLTNPIVQAKIRERYGSHLPLNEAVVSPQDIYASSKLVTVYQE